MYRVKITEQRGKKTTVKIIEFNGEFTEEMRAQWEKIKKHAKNTMQFEFMPIPKPANVGVFDER